MITSLLPKRALYKNVVSYLQKDGETLEGYPQAPDKDKLVPKIDTQHNTLDGQLTSLSSRGEPARNALRAVLGKKRLMDTVQQAGTFAADVSQQQAELAPLEQEKTTKEADKKEIDADLKHLGEEEEAQQAVVDHLKAQLTASLQRIHSCLAEIERLRTACKADQDTLEDLSNKRGGAYADLLAQAEALGLGNIGGDSSAPSMSQEEETERYRLRQNIDLYQRSLSAVHDLLISEIRSAGAYADDEEMCEATVLKGLVDLETDMPAGLGQTIATALTARQQTEGSFAVQQQARLQSLHSKKGEQDSKIGTLKERLAELEPDITARRAELKKLQELSAAEQSLLTNGKQQLTTLATLLSEMRSLREAMSELGENIAHALDGYEVLEIERQAFVAQAEKMNALNKLLLGHLEAFLNDGEKEIASALTKVNGGQNAPALVFDPKLKQQFDAVKTERVSLTISVEELIADPETALSNWVKTNINTSSKDDFAFLYQAVEDLLNSAAQNVLDAAGITNHGMRSRVIIKLNQHLGDGSSKGMISLGNQLRQANTKWLRQVKEAGTSKSAAQIIVGDQERAQVQAKKAQLENRLSNMTLTVLDAVVDTDKLRSVTPEQPAQLHISRDGESFTYTWKQTTHEMPALAAQADQKANYPVITINDQDVSEAVLDSEQSVIALVQDLVQSVLDGTVQERQWAFEVSEVTTASSADSTPTS